jgi:hypothetical protein
VTLYQVDEYNLNRNIIYIFLLGKTKEILIT